MIVYPNPSSGNFKITVKEKIDYVSVTNTLGVEERFKISDINTSLRGLLILKVYTENNIYIRKLLVE